MTRWPGASRRPSGAEAPPGHHRQKTSRRCRTTAPIRAPYFASATRRRASVGQGPEHDSRADLAAIRGRLRREARRATHHARPRERIRVTDFVQPPPIGHRPKAEDAAQKRECRPVGSRPAVSRRRADPGAPASASARARPTTRSPTRAARQQKIFLRGVERLSSRPRAAPHSNNRRVFARGLRMLLLASVTPLAARAPASERARGYATPERFHNEL